MQVLFYALPVWYWYIGAISVADFVLLQSLIAILSNTFSMLSMNFMQFFKVYGSIRDGLKLLSKPCDVNDVSGAVKLKVDNGAIEFANINYHYKGARFLFEGFNLRIAGGEKDRSGRPFGIGQVESDQTALPLLRHPARQNYD